MKNIKVSIILALVFSMLTSCKGVSQETPNILGPVCGKLCWNNIVVGFTTKKELLNTIGNLTNVDQASISDSGQEGLFDERVYFSFHSNPTNKSTIVRVAVYLIDQKVIALDLNDNLDTHFQEVVSGFGEPELVSASKNQGGQVWISFINPSKGISFGFIAHNEKSNITPDTEIRRITLFDPALYQELLQADWLLPGYRQFILYPWVGYGSIEEHYWPPRKP